MFNERKITNALTGRNTNITTMPSQRPTKWSQEEPVHDAKECAGPESTVGANMKNS